MSPKNEQNITIETYNKIASVVPLAQRETAEPAMAEDKSLSDGFQDRDCVNIYLHQISKIPLLDPEEEINLFRGIIRFIRSCSLR